MADPLGSYCIALGAPNVRVGLEDSLYAGKRENGQLQR